MVFLWPVEGIPYIPLPRFVLSEMLHVSQFRCEYFKRNSLVDCYFSYMFAFETANKMINKGKSIFLTSF